MPSVSHAMAQTRLSPSRASASARANSLLGPPRPEPVRVTVTSPPLNSTVPGAAARARRHCSTATSRASPSSASPRITGCSPLLLAVCAAASSATCGVATSTVRQLASRGSPGFGVSSAACSRWRPTAGGSVMRYRSRMARASAKVVASGTVGPEAITEGSSPGTSEIASVSTGAG